MMQAEHSEAQYWQAGRWQAGSPPQLAGTVATDCHVPGLVNAHSHAFQRAMAGAAEFRTPAAGADSFWSWRQTMYDLAARFDPDTLHAVAAQAYLEMLEAGYTQVCEFHYLHLQPDGRPYADAAAMSHALLAAAREVGIGITLLPVLYLQGGFDGRALAPQQRRFGLALDAFLALVATLRRQEDAQVRIGIALHSLRAVPAAALQAVLQSGLAERGPLHMHISEQTAEVEQCLAHTGQRPVAWLLDHAAVDARWCLVHATHMDADETARLARSGAVVALCPSTEANLGDGLFPLGAFLNRGGHIAVGSDSNISISPIEELRWLEYGQRLLLRARNLAADAAQPHSGARLFGHAHAGGVQAAGVDAQAAGWLGVERAHPLLSGARGDALFDRLLFAGNVPLLREVHAAGAWRVRAGAHPARAAVAVRYRAALARLCG